MTMRPDPDDLRAAELAFGLLAPDEAAAAERRAADDAAFADEVALWRARATAMIALPGMAPRPSLWPEIARRTVGAAAAPRPGRLRAWQGLCAITTALAAAAIVLLVSRPERPVPPPPVIVRAAPETELALLTGSGPGAMAIGYHQARRSLTVIASGVRLGGRDAQLWLLPPGGDPVSLGVLDLRGDRAVLLLRRTGRPLGTGANLAISLEPAGGSPTGLPTGPVILTGTIEPGGAPAAS